MGLCERCKNNDCGYASENVIRCGDFEENIVQTNADSIRAMSDEELAVFLDTWGCCHHCIEHERLSDNRWFSDEKCDEKCAEHCLEWLKQPADMRGEEDG